MTSSIETLAETISRLRKKTFLELAQMTKYQEEEKDCTDGLIKLAIWKDDITSSELRIIVQIYRSWGLGIGQMKSDGFRITTTGVQPLEPGDLDEFS